MKPKTLNLWVHDERYSKHEIIVNPDYFPCAVGDLLEITQTKMGTLKPALVLQVTWIDPDFMAKQPQLQISISQTIATQFDLSARSNIHVQKVM